MFENEFAKTEYIENDNAVLHIWKKEAHYNDYRQPVTASLELLRLHPGSLYIVDARNGFEDSPEDVAWGFHYFLPELRKTGCRIWGFILPEASEIEDEIDLWTDEIKKNFTVIRAASYDEIIRKASEFGAESSRAEAEIQLVPLEASDREQFILDNQEAFNYGALVESGLRDTHFEEDGEIISRSTVSRAIDTGAAYRIVQDGRPVGGAVIKTAYDHGELKLLFVSPAVHGRGIGYGAWCAIEAMHPEVTVWETAAPYFEKRSIHFYVNRCGFRITAFYHAHYPDPRKTDGTQPEMFALQKIMPATPESLQAQIDRITYYEYLMNLAESGDPRILRVLSDYYGSAAWKRDFAADEAGRLPAGLKRGVLSEDGVYHLLERFRS